MRAVLTVVVLCVAVATAVVVRDAPFWKQCDPRWGNEAVGNCTFTICESDGSVVSLAMYLSSVGYGFNPSKLNELLLANGMYTNDCKIYWEKLGYFGDAHIGDADFDAVVFLLSKKAGVFPIINNGTRFSFAVGYYTNKTVIINDPIGDRRTINWNNLKKCAILTPNSP